MLVELIVVILLGSLNTCFSVVLVVTWLIVRLVMAFELCFGVTLCMLVELIVVMLCNALVVGLNDCHSILFVVTWLILRVLMLYDMRFGVTLLRLIELIVVILVNTFRPLAYYYAYTFLASWFLMGKMVVELWFQYLVVVELTQLVMLVYVCIQVAVEYQQDLVLSVHIDRVRADKVKQTKWLL
jgi:hypothetical protein